MPLFRLKPGVDPGNHPWLVHGECYFGYLYPGPSREDATERVVIVHNTDPETRTEPLGYEFFEDVDYDDCPNWDRLREYIGPGEH